MRAKFSYVLPGIISLMMVVALSASAQDDVPGPTSGSSPSAVTNLFSNDSEFDDKPLLMEQSSFRNVITDSLSRKVVPVPAAKAQKSGAADPKKSSSSVQGQGDPLNFNFLYYILQKFKASELME